MRRTDDGCATDVRRQRGGGATAVRRTRAGRTTSASVARLFLCERRLSVARPPSIRHKAEIRLISALFRPYDGCHKAEISGLMTAAGVRRTDDARAADV